MIWKNKYGWSYINYCIYNNINVSNNTLFYLNYTIVEELKTRCDNKIQRN